MLRLALALLMLAMAVPLSAQTHPCDSNAVGPFVVQSARAFTVQWCTAVVRPDPNNPTQTISERVDGHYLSLDGGAKMDIAATDLGISTVTNRRGWAYTLASGLAKGEHTLALSSWNYQLNGGGTPTTTRQEGGQATLPFSVADPVSDLPPLAPSGVRVIR